MFSYTKGLFVLVLVGFSYAYPSGAPSNICGRYSPGHRNRNTNVNNPPQGPYRLDVQPLSGGQYQVTLRATGGIPFKGFLIQGMQSNPTWKRFPEGAADIVGTFQPNQNMNSFMSQPSQVRRCAGMAGATVITHSDSSPKTTATVTWTPPLMGSDRNYKLLATVVRDSDTFYVVQSDIISTQGGASTQASQGTSNGTATTSLSTQTVDKTIISPTGSLPETSFQNPSQGSGSFLTPNQGSGSFMFPVTGSGMSSQGGMDGFSTDANTLTDTSAINLAVPPGSFFSRQDTGFSSPGSGFSSEDSGFTSQGSLFSSQNSGFSSPGIGVSSPGSEFSSQDSGFNSMTAMSRVPGASPLPIIPNNVNFPQNLPTISGPASEISSLSNINESNHLNGSKNFTAPFFTAKGIQMDLGIEFIGPQSNNVSTLSNDTSIQSDSILLSGPTTGVNSSTDMTLTAANISSEFAANPPIALEMVDISTGAPERLPASGIGFQPPVTPTPFQPSNTVQGFESANTFNANISSNTSSVDPVVSFNPASTLDPLMGSSTYDPYWDNSSFDPFFASSTIDPFQNASTLDPILLFNTSESSKSRTSVNPLQPPITANLFQPPTTAMPFLPPTTVKAFRDPKAAKPFQESNTVIPFQAPTKPKPIEIPMSVEPLIPAVTTPKAQTSTVSPIQVPTTGLPFNVPTSPLPSILPTTFEQPQPPKTILFEPPAIPESIIPPANNAPKTISFESPNISESITIPAYDPSQNILFNLSTNQRSINPPVNESPINILFDPPTTQVSLEPLATYDPLAPPPPIFIPDNFPTPVALTLTNTSVTDSVTVPITRPVASIDLPVRIDSPPIRTLPTGDVRVVLRSPATSTSEMGSGPFIPDSVSLSSSSSSSSSPTFEVVSTSLSDVMGSVDLSGDTTSASVDLSSSLDRPTLQVEPLVNIINVPVPSGQIAAVLNFSRTAGATVPTGFPPLPSGGSRFVTIGRPMGQFGTQPGSFGTTIFGQQTSAGQFGAPQFRGPSTFGQRTTFPMGPIRRPMTFGGQGQRFGSTQFGGSFGGPRTIGSTDAGAGSFGFQQFTSSMPSGFVGQSTQFGGAGTQFGGQGSTGVQFPGQGPTFIGQGSVRQFRFGPQGRQVQTFRFQPQQGQFTTLRFGSQPGQFSGGRVMTSGSTQGEGQGSTGFSTFGQTGATDSSSFLTPVGV